MSKTVHPYNQIQCFSWSGNDRLLFSQSPPPWPLFLIYCHTYNDILSLYHHHSLIIIIILTFTTFCFVVSNTIFVTNVCVSWAVDSFYIQLKMKKIKNKKMYFFISKIYSQVNQTIWWKCACLQTLKTVQKTTSTRHQFVFDTLTCQEDGHHFP